MADPTPDAIAEVLRLAHFALEHSAGSLLAFAPLNLIVERDIARNDEVQKMIDGLLVDLPPEPPLTPEQEAWAAEQIRRTLDSFDA